MPNSRFSALRDRKNELTASDEVVSEKPIERSAEPEAKSAPVSPIEVKESLKKKVGRPPGRRSNPNYIQISAQIPKNLLFDVQDILRQEQRRTGTRSPRPVCDVIEMLLSEWVEKQAKS